MKIKRIPEDFQVDEVSALPPADGAYSLYLLTKRSIGTPEAIEELQRKWNLPRRRISYGGLKDRHALTRQYVTIEHGPRRDLRERLFDLKHIGTAPRHFGPHDIAGNRFQIVLRDMPNAELELAVSRLAAIGTQGLPNYFDDQRFGSVGVSGEFIAVPWCLGNFERALWLALADFHRDDPGDERAQKKLLQDLWGQWTACKAALSRSHRRSIVTFMDDRPGDFRGAFARLNVDLRGLYLAAFQSHVWNQMLGQLLRERCPADLEDVPLKLGPAAFPRGASPLPPEVTGAILPLPSARNKDEAEAWLPLLDRVLGSYGLELRQMRVKYPRDSFFSKGLRAAIVPAEGLAHETAADDLYPGRQKLQLKFTLPRGSYATILVKRLTAGAAANDAPDSTDETEQTP